MCSSGAATSVASTTVIRIKLYKKKARGKIFKPISTNQKFTRDKKENFSQVLKHLNQTKPQKSNESDPIPSPFFRQPGSRLVVTDRLLGENIQHGCWQAGEVSVSQLNQVWPNSAEGPYLNTYKYFAPGQREILARGSPELRKDNFKIYLGDFLTKIQLLRLL